MLNIYQLIYVALLFIKIQPVPAGSVQQHVTDLHGILADRKALPVSAIKPDCFGAGLTHPEVLTGDMLAENSQRNNKQGFYAESSELPFRSDNNILTSIGGPWYDTWWLKFMAALLVMVAAYAILRMRIKGIEARNHMLESKIAERTAELEDLVIALRSSKAQLHQELRLVTWIMTSISHDIRTPLNFVMSSTAQLESQIRENQLDAAINTNALISDTIVRVYQLTGSVLSFVRLGMPGGIPRFESIPLKKLVTEKVLFFSKINELNRSTIEVDIGSDVQVHTNGKLLGIIVHNLIDNAIKIEVGNKINIYTRYLENKLQLVVADKGPGLARELITWINSPTEYQEIPETKHFGGLGLLMIKTMTSALSIGLHVENKNGACFYLEFS